MQLFWAVCDLTRLISFYFLDKMGCQQYFNHQLLFYTESWKKAQIHNEVATGSATRSLVLVMVIDKGENKGYGENMVKNMI